MDLSDSQRSPITIRRATQQDSWALAALLVQSFQLYPWGQDWLAPAIAVGLQWDLAQRFGVARYACFVAVNGLAQIVGTVEVGYRQPLPWQMTAPYPYLSNLAVRPADRGQGIAAQLMQAAEQLVQTDWQGQDLYLHVMGNNLTARQLYLQRGYVIHQGGNYQGGSYQGGSDQGGSHPPSWSWPGTDQRLFLHKHLDRSAPPIAAPPIDKTRETAVSLGKSVD